MQGLSSPVRSTESQLIVSVLSRTGIRKSWPAGMQMHNLYSDTFVALWSSSLPVTAMASTSIITPSDPSRIMLPLILRNKRSWSALITTSLPRILIPSLPFTRMAFSDLITKEPSNLLVILLAVAFLMCKFKTPLGRPKFGKVVENALVFGVVRGSNISKPSTFRNSTLSWLMTISGSSSFKTYAYSVLDSFLKINIVIFNCSIELLP